MKKKAQRTVGCHIKEQEDEFSTLFTYAYSFLEGSVWRWTLLLGMVVRGRTVFLSKRERERVSVWREATCTQRKAPLDPSTSSPSISHPPFLLALATRSASQRLLCINKYCSYSPYRRNRLLDNSPPPHRVYFCLRHPSKAPWFGQRTVRCWSPTPYVHHPSTWMGPTSGLLCPLLYCT